MGFNFELYGYRVIRCFSNIVLIILAFGFAINASADPVTLDFIGAVKTRKGIPVADTTPYINIFEKFYWELTVLNQKNEKKFIKTVNPDTIPIETNSTVFLSTTFRVNPHLVNQIFSLQYRVDGSLKLRLNGETIIETGKFVINKKSELKNLILPSDFVDFQFKDTVETLEIEYVAPNYGKSINLELSFYQRTAAADKKAEHLRNVNNDLRVGFYYLAFGIVFLFFYLFHREKTENAYFAGFCIFTGLHSQWSNFHFSDINYLGAYFLVFLFEFLSLFFAKVLRNKEKSKVPLVIIVAFSIFSYAPFIKYNTFSIFANEDLPYILYAFISVFITYSFFSSIYLLFSGFGQKRWEARLIGYFFFSTITVFYLVPLIVTLIVGGQKIESMPVLNNFPMIGVFVYPLSAALVLGRRNGLNYKQLVSQIHSIKRLSEENLEKELEKKAILENQNAELEKKVRERTIEVTHQKELIEVKNKSITDNLIYAQRIQSAILPDIKLIYKTLEQAFIFYQPKDIVSGDFYAFAEMKDRVLMIVGDCTGHGVSGAFMSMIGISLLNQIINEKKILEPAQILTQLNLAIIESLKQTENETNDGMDIVVASFDLKARGLQFASANRPVWVVRNGEMLVFKPDKFPIGGLQVAKNKNFTNQILSLLPNDTVYIFTDGYADQFGGERGKKLMTSKFKELLLAINKLSMREQESHLKDFFEQWKGEQEQVDDVLVIGVRV